MNKVILLFSLLAFNLNAQEVNLSTYHAECHESYVGIQTDGNLSEYLISTNANRTSRYSEPYLEDIGGLDNILNSIGIGEGQEIRYSKSERSRLNENLIYITYDHYFNDIKVKGSRLKLVVNSGESFAPIGGPGPTGPPVGPCDNLYSISPKVVKIDESFNTDHLSENQILASLELSEEVASIELGIFHNLYNECGASLIYTVNDKLKARKIFVDAKTGATIHKVSTIANMLAPVERYGDSNGMVDLDDRTIGGVTELVSSDGLIFTHDLGGIVWGPSTPSDFTSDKIPSTINSAWSTNDAVEDVYQAHFVIQDLLPTLDDFIIDLDRLDRINVGANIIGDIAGDPYGSALLEGNEAYVWLGTDPDGVSSAIYDIAAHEFGHVVIFLNGMEAEDYQSRALHEMLSDMYSVYSNFKRTGTLDWVSGEELRDGGFRDMSNNNCIGNTTFDGASRSVSGQYLLAEQMSQLLYLLTVGGDGVEPIGIELAISIITEASANVGENPSVLEFMNEMIEIADRTLDLCQSASIRSAWSAVICELDVGANPSNANAEFVMLSDRINEINDFNCNNPIEGPNFVCEEDQSLSLFLYAGTPNSFYDWRIIGNQSTGFGTYNGSLQGNSQLGGSSLELNQFPNYPFYPQTITITVYDHTTKRTYEKKVVIIDCDGDDPTCEEYYGPPTYRVDNTNGSEQFVNSISYVQVYDLNGRLLNSGSINSKISLDYEGLLIFIYFDKDKNHVKSEIKFYSESNQFNR